MTEIAKIFSRVGTCRSGTSFDIPHMMEKANCEEFWELLRLNDRVDSFCMIEAKMIASADPNQVDSERESLELMNEFIWTTPAIEELRPHLEDLGLFTSLAYVQFGKKLLL